MARKCVWAIFCGCQEGQIVRLDHPVERRAVCALNGQASFNGQIVSTGQHRAFQDRRLPPLSPRSSTHRLREVFQNAHRSARQPCRTVFHGQQFHGPIESFQPFHLKSIEGSFI